MFVASKMQRGNENAALEKSSLYFSRITFWRPELFYYVYQSGSFFKFIVIGIAVRPR